MAGDETGRGGGVARGGAFVQGLGRFDVKIESIRLGSDQS